MRGGGGGEREGFGRGLLDLKRGVRRRSFETFGCYFDKRKRRVFSEEGEGSDRERVTF